jgi:hypothetical protein
MDTAPAGNNRMQDETLPDPFAKLTGKSKPPSAKNCDLQQTINLPDLDS